MRKNCFKMFNHTVGVITYEVTWLILGLMLCVSAKLLQSCLTLCDPMDCSPPGLSVHGILQARVLEWVAIFLLQGDLPHPGIEPRSPAFQADALTSEPPGKQTAPKQALNHLCFTNGFSD